VFSSLAPRLSGSRVLDLFAGSGALGIEALSRGADAVVFVEMDREACDLIRRNLQACGWALSDEVRLVQADALRWLKTANTEAAQYDIILADPPYMEGVEEEILALVSHEALLAPDGILVIESGARQVKPEPPEGLYLSKAKVYGDTKISQYNWKGKV